MKNRITKRGGQRTGEWELCFGVAMRWPRPRSRRRTARISRWNAQPVARVSEMGHSTRAWLDLQSSNREAAPALPMLGAEAGLAYRRYMESFKSKIPDLYGSALNTGSGSGGGAMGATGGTGPARFELTCANPCLPPWPVRSALASRASWRHAMLARAVSMARPRFGGDLAEHRNRGARCDRHRQRVFRAPAVTAHGRPGGDGGGPDPQYPGRLYDGYHGRAAERGSQRFHGPRQQHDPSARRAGRWDTRKSTYFSTSGNPLNAVQVTTTQIVPYFFLGPTRSVSATATALASNINAFSLEHRHRFYQNADFAAIGAAQRDPGRLAENQRVAERGRYAESRYGAHQIAGSDGGARRLDDAGVARHHGEFPAIDGRHGLGAADGGDPINASILQKVAAAIPAGRTS